MADNDGSIVLGTELDTKGLHKGLGSLGSIVSKGMKVAGIAVAAVGAGLVTAGKYAVGVGSDFDTAMSQLAATMGTTVDQIGNLSDVAQEMGSTTKFTATEAAEAMNYLAQNGFDAEKQIGALPTVLNLAAAGAMELGSAADLVANSMNVLGLGTDDMTMYSNQLAIVAASASGDVTDFGEAILVCGGQCKLANVDLADMNTALGILADNGIKGSEGGTNLRNVIKNLYTPTAQAKKAMDELGIATANSDGTLRNMQDVLQDLNGALSGMSEDERINAMNDIFDTRTIAAANALLANSTDRWDELNAALGEASNTSTQAADMAATQLDNLEGDVTLFKSALEGLGLAAYENLRDPLRDSVQWGTGLLQQMTQATRDGGLAGLVGVMGDVLAQCVQKVLEFAPKLMTAATDLIMQFVTGIRDNLPQIVTSMAEVGAGFITAIVEIVPTLVETFLTLIPMLAVALAEQLPTLIPSVIDGMVALTFAIVGCLPLFIDAAIQLANGIMDGFLNAMPTIIDAIPEYVNQVAQAWIEGVPLLVEALVSIVGALASSLPDIIAGLVDALPSMIESICAVLISLTPVLIQGLISIVMAIVSALPEIIISLISALPQIIQMVVAALLECLPQIIAGCIQLVFGIVQALPEIIVALISALPYIVESLVSALIGLASTLVACGAEFVTAMIEGITGTWASLTAKAGTLINQLLSNITGWFQGMIQRGQAFVTNLWSGITGSWSRITTGLSNSCRNLISSVTNWFKGFSDVGRNIVNGLWNGISAGWSWLTGKVSSLAKNLLSAAKRALGIRSPSTAFRDQVGAMMAKGVGVGWEKEIPKVYRDIQTSVSAEQAEVAAHTQAKTAGTSSVFGGEIVQIGEINVHSDKLTENADYDRVVRKAGEKYARAARQTGGLCPA